MDIPDVLENDSLYENLKIINHLASVEAGSKLNREYGLEFLTHKNHEGIS